MVTLNINGQEHEFDAVIENDMITLQGLHMDINLVDGYERLLQMGRNDFDTDDDFDDEDDYTDAKDAYADVYVKENLEWYAKMHYSMSKLDSQLSHIYSIEILYHSNN